MLKMDQYSYITYNDIVNNVSVRTYIQSGNDALGVLGFTEHGFAHAAKTLSILFQKICQSDLP